MISVYYYLINPKNVLLFFMVYFLRIVMLFYVIFILKIFVYDKNIGIHCLIFDKDVHNSLHVVIFVALIGVNTKFIFCLIVKFSIYSHPVI